MKLKFTPFTILIDTREQLPYAFRNIDKKGRIVVTRFQGLKTGDYSLAGHESEIMIERKSLVDLYSTIGSELSSGKEEDRFEREFQRMSEAEIAVVVVEASMEELLNPTAFRDDWRSGLHPNSVFGVYTSWSLRYPKVHWCFAGNREQAERLTFELLRKYYEQKQRQEKESAA